MIACEPDSAACLMSSARAGVPARADGDLSTVMACLRCAEPSPAAWPAIAAGIDAFVTVSDEQVVDTVRALASAPDTERIDAGASGACGLAGLQALASAPALAELRRASAFGRSTRAFVVITEGA
jgi:diaminopropionate ammonia-lyase